MLKSIKTFFEEYGGLIKDHIYETIGTFVSFIKSKLVFVFELLIAYAIFNYIKPINDRLYLGGYSSTNIDLLELDPYFWTSFILLILYFIYRQVISSLYKLYKGSFNFKFNLKSSIVEYSIVFLISFILSYWFRDLGKQTALYFNSYYFEKPSTHVFQIDRINEDRVKLISGDLGNLNSSKYVDIIDAKRILNHQKSIYELEDNDTIKVTFKKGFLEELYLK